MIEEKETYKYLGILEVGTMKQMEKKEKKKKKKNISGERENISKASSAVGISS